jgi:hypothetical protein
MGYLIVKYTFLLVTAPIWVIPWAISKSRSGRKRR